MTEKNGTQSDPFESDQYPPETELPKASDERDDYVADENEVPSGSAKEVLDWVGDDEARAQEALDAEQAKDHPRKGLTSDLQDLLDK